ncbi:MAG TPA: PEGA domain-containing protein [Polyangia bacterium]|nr:PEGA domain-containing protein [Polyangia bacterium]
MRFTLLAFAVACQAIFLFSAGIARADDSADELIKEGIALRRVGRDEQALPKFERAYRLQPTPRAAAQLGLCRQALGRLVDAENLLAESLDAKDDAWVNKNRDTLDRALAYIHSNIGRLVVTGEPAGAELVIGGRVVGRLPLDGALRVDPGPLELVVQAPGFESATRKISVPVGGRETLTVKLNPAPAVIAAPPMAAPVVTGQPSIVALNAKPPEIATLSVTATPAVEETRSTPVYQKAWFWGVLAAVVVAGTVTAVLVSRGGTSYPKSDRSEPFP